MDYSTCYGEALPAGFVARMRRQLEPEEAERFFEAMAREPVTGVRLNPNKRCALPESLDGEEVAWCGEGRVLADRPEFTLMPQLHAGAFYVQEPASMVFSRLVERLADGREQRVLEVCAAPGGKTTAMLAALPGKSVLVANEYVPARASVLAENVTKWGDHRCVVTNSDSSAFARCGEIFDIVVVDAPCSGEGMMRKEPMALKQWSEGLIAQCAGLQREILANAVEALRPGGTLVFSTCTYNEKENDENAAWLRETFGLEPRPVDIGPWGERSELRFMPHTGSNEGLFVSVFSKPGDVATVRLRGGKRAAKPTPEEKAALEHVDFGNDTVAITDEEGVRALSAETAAVVEALRKAKVRIRQAGVCVGSLKKNGFVPAHALALSTSLRKGRFPEVELGLEDAISYLRRDLARLPEATPKGIVLLTHAGLPIGWAKNLGTRANNLYPEKWRIRKQV